jgi:hypothetical protein
MLIVILFSLEWSTNEYLKKISFYLKVYPTEITECQIILHVHYKGLTNP